MTHKRKKDQEQRKTPQRGKEGQDAEEKGAEEKIRTECREKRRTRTNRNLGGIKIKKKKIPGAERKGKKRIRIE